MAIPKVIIVLYSKLQMKRLNLFLSFALFPGFGALF